MVFALTDLGSKMKAERYRRDHPDADEHEVERAVALWLSDRPGAPQGDAVGRPISWPRVR